MGVGNTIFDHSHITFEKAVTVYGSANASRPALLDTEGNTEVVVMLPPAPRGTLTHLNLEPSLQAGSIAGALRQKEWSGEEEEVESENY